MILKYYESGVKSSESEVAHSDLVTIVESTVAEMSQLMRQASDAGSHQKFFDCLFHIYKHYPQMVSSFASDFIYNLRQSRFKEESLSQGLEMLLG
jgi:hypothetical protein